MGTPQNRIVLNATGGIGLRIVLIVVSMALLGAVLGVVIHHSRYKHEECYRKAERIAEYGLQTALEKLQEEPAWSAGFQKTACEGGWYSVTMACRMGQRDSVLLAITSQGCFASASSIKSCLLVHLPGNPDQPWTMMGGIHSK